MYIVVDGINLKEKSQEELIIIIQQYMDMERRNAFMEKESSRAQSAMAKGFQFMKKRMEEALSENQQLKEQMARLAEQNCLKTRDVFGRRTEKLSDLLDSTPARDEIDGLALPQKRGICPCKCFCGTPLYTCHFYWP